MNFIHEGRDQWPDVGNGDLPCCMGVAVYGPGRCTCWRPIYDQEQQTARPGPMPKRTKCCGDCAFRMGSPERSGDARMAHSDPDDLQEVVTGRSVFACHVGMRRVVAWQHPSGARIDATSGDYDPLIIDGIAYQADGSPAFACAGQRAMRVAAQRAGGAALTEQLVLGGRCG